MDERDKADEQWVIDTRDKVNAATTSWDCGEGLDGKELISRILGKFRQARETQG